MACAHETHENSRHATDPSWRLSARRRDAPTLVCRLQTPGAWFDLGCYDPRSTTWPRIDAWLLPRLRARSLAGRLRRATAFRPRRRSIGPGGFSRRLLGKQCSANPPADDTCRVVTMGRLSGLWSAPAT